MKLVILIVFSLIFTVYSEDVLEIIEPGPDQNVAPSIFDTIFTDYVSGKEAFVRRTEKKAPRSKSSKRKQVIKSDKIEEFSGLIEKPSKVRDPEYEKLEGRRGLGFDKRTATSYGLRRPITAKSLESVERKYNNNKPVTVSL